MKISKETKKLIVGSLLKQYGDKLCVEAKRQALDDKVLQIYKTEYTPAYIVKFAADNPIYMKWTTTNIDLWDLTDNKLSMQTRYVYPSIKWLDPVVRIITPNHIIRSHKDIYKEALELADIHHKIYEFCKKTDCALYDINSDNVLKKEFPEAYDIFCKIKNVPNTTSNRCDSIENIRALLNK